jgi:hypothetical protein
MTINKQIPRIISNEPDYIQRMYMREFADNLQKTNSFVQAENAANLFLSRTKQLHTNKYVYSVCEFVEEIDTDNNDERLVPENILAEIKKTDQKPFFALFGIAKDHISTGGYRKLWSFGAIKELVQKIKSSVVPIISDTHTVDESDIRPTLGKCVNAFIRKSKDGLKNAFAVMYIDSKDTINKIKQGIYNVCSIEANVIFDKPIDDTPYVSGVNEVKRICIADGNIMTPGFDNAKLVTCIQEFANPQNKLVKEADIHASDTVNQVFNQDNIIGENKHMENLSLIEVQTIIERNGWLPSQVYKQQQFNDDLRAKEWAKELAKPEIEKATKEIQLKADAQITSKQKEFDAIKAENDQYAKIKSDNLIDKYSSISKHLVNKPDKMVQYIKQQLSGLDLAKVENAEQIINEKIEQSLKTIESFGIKFEDVKAENKNENKTDTLKAVTTDSKTSEVAQLLSGI